MLAREANLLATRTTATQWRLPAPISGRRNHFVLWIVDSRVRFQKVVTGLSNRRKLQGSSRLCMRVKRAGESGAYRDFHNLTYLEYAYLQLGRFRDAQQTVDIVAAQYQALPDKQTAPDTPELQSRYVRGRTIYALRGA
jgi:hypothetical protein